ncbi:hypothetical protein DXG03_005170 [Asterophora parasitica]|uniref:RecA family profile 1 domain-containing protein n=1 Tax=Asterophora parasitica TaxID=117018 RepID=A0A9P7GA82_9AGAR|nr:hypothetical protein DXG03_005170 [Asterophora parasitica]
MRGASAAGKTQFALQLSLFAQLPEERKGLLGSTCYLTTSSKLPTDRMVQILETHPSLSTADCTLDDIHTIPTTTIPRLIYVLSEMLPPFIVDQPKKAGRKPVKLVVIDALAELFHTSDKTTTNTLVERSKNIAQISALLHALAAKHQIAMVVLNEVVDAFDRGPLPGDDDHDLLYSEQSRWFSRAHSIAGESKKEASLGLVWANQVNVRILLSRTGRRRYLDDVELPRAKRRRLEVSSSGTPPAPIHATTDDLTLIRRLTVVFSCISTPTSLDYIVTEAGIVVLPEDELSSRKREVLLPKPTRTRPPVASALTLASCSQISPLDIGTVEERRTAVEETLKKTRDEESQEDEWEKYWASDDISADLYDEVDALSSTIPS